MATTDFLTKQRKQIGARLEELRPLYEEYLTLEKAQEALDRVETPVRRAVGRPRGPGRPPGSRNSTKTVRTTRKKRSASSARATKSTRRAGARRKTRRTRSGGTRAEQTLAAIKQSPGIGISDLAKKLGIRPNYLYRVTAQLHRERRIRRRNGGFQAA